MSATYQLDPVSVANSVKINLIQWNVAAGGAGTSANQGLKELVPTGAARVVNDSIEHFLLSFTQVCLHQIN